MKASWHAGLMWRDFVAAVKGFSFEGRQAKQSAKTALSCVIAIFTANFFDLSDAYWAGLSVMVMMQPNASAAIRKAWMRAGGACAGAFMGVVVAGLFLQDHLRYSLALFVLVAFGLYMGNRHKYGYFYSYMALNAAIISMISVTTPDITVYIAFTRGVVVSIGVLVALFVDILIWPEYAADEFSEKTVRLRIEAAGCLRRVILGFFGGKLDETELKSAFAMLREKSEKLLLLAADAEYEGKVLRRNLNLTRSDAAALRRALSLLSAFFESVSKHDDIVFVRGYADVLSEMSGEMLSLAKDTDGDKREALLKKIEQRFKLLEDSYTDIRSNERHRNYTVSDVLFFHETVYMFRVFFDALAGTEVEDFSGTSASSAQRDDDESDLFRLHILGRLFRAHIPTFKLAVKGALGILFVFWLWFWAEIPGGGLNMSIAVITVLQLDLMSTYHRGILRFSGCLVGAAAGFGFLALQVESLTVLCCIIFVVIFIFAYIWSARPGIAYLGCQAAIAFLVAAVPEHGPTTTVAPVVERLVGIFLGVISIWSINAVLWPQDLVRHFGRRLGRIAAKLASATLPLSHKFAGSGDTFPRFSADFNALRATAECLRGQAELREGNCVAINEWLDNMERIYTHVNMIFKMDREHIALLSEISPGIGSLLCGVLRAAADMERATPDALNLPERIKMLRSGMDNINTVLRAGKIKERDILFKQNFAHLIITLYRLCTVAEHIHDLDIYHQNPRLFRRDDDEDMPLAAEDSANVAPAAG